MSLIDNPSFDPSQAFTDLIITHSFEELLLLQSNLTCEIKSLDGNMQTLVYENYNKFISATDTIRSMKTHVESMESEMKLLEESMEKIQTISKKVSEKVTPKQQQICKLINVYDELQKIKNICDLPSLLKAAIDRNVDKMHLDFESVANSYNDSISFLVQHKFDTSYASIYQETSECTEKIKKMIWEKLTDPNLSPETFAKYCCELHLFNENSEKLPSIYCNYFLNLFKEKITNLYNLSNLVAVKKSQFMIPEGSSLDSVIEDSKKIPDNEENIEVLDHTFAWYVLQIHEHVTPLLAFALKHFKSIFESEFNAQFQAFSKEIVLMLIQNSKNKLKEIRSNLGEFCIALHFIQLDLKILSPYAANVNDRFNEFLEFLVRFQIEKVVEGLQGLAFDTISRMCTEIYESEEKLPEKIEGPALKASFNLLYFLLSEIIRLEPMLQNCKNFISSSATVSLIVSHILNFFQILRKSLLNFSTNTAGSQEYENNSFRLLKKNGNFLIAMLKFFIYLEESVPRIISILTKTFYELDYEKSEVLDVINRIAKPEFLVVLKLCQEDLLLFYIEYYSKLFRDLIFEYCNEKWRFQNEPIDVSETMCKVVTTLLAARKELKAFFQGDFITAQKFSRKRVKHNVELELERIHARKTKIMENLKFDLTSIVGTLAKIVLKGLYEEVRMYEFGTGGYQQVEVDAHFLGSCIGLTLLDDSLVSGYIHEILSSTSTRCTFTQNLQPTILDSIIENKKQQLKIKLPKT